MVRALAVSIAAAAGIASAASATQAEAPTKVARSRQVFVILSEASEIALKDGKKAATGVYLNELMIPAMTLIDQGHSLVFATPNGKKPAFDASSDHPRYFGGDEKKHARARKLLTELKLSGPRARLLRFSDLAKKDMSEVAAVFVPGGHAPVVDLAASRELGAFLRRAHEKAIPTALICHGPVATLSALDDPGSFISALSAGNTDKARSLASAWIYQGYQMSVFSTPEEKVAEERKLKGLMPYYPDEALAAAGGTMSLVEAGKSHVVSDRELITGQNPASAEELGQALARRLGTSRIQ